MIEVEKEHYADSADIVYIKSEYIYCILISRDRKQYLIRTSLNDLEEDF